MNGKMKSVRFSIECNYGTTASTFTFIGMKGKFKVYEMAGVARIYIVAMLLKNLHACLYGNDELLQRCSKKTSWNVISVVETLCNLDL